MRYVGIDSGEEPPKFLGEIKFTVIQRATSLRCSASKLTRPASPHPRRNLVALDLLNFFKADAQATFGPFLATYLMAARGWSFDHIGIVMAVPGLVTLLFQVPAGAFVDASRHKRELIALCSILIAATCLETVYAKSLPVMVLAMALFGLATVVLPPAIAALTMGLVGHRGFARRMGRNEMISHIGAVAASLSAGAIGRWLAAEDIFYFAALMSLGAGVAAMVIRAADINHSVARAALVDSQGGERIVTLSELFSDRRIIVFAMSVVLFHIANAAQLPFVSEMLSLRAPKLASIYTAACVLIAQTVMVPVAWITGRSASLVGRKPLFLLALAMLPLRAALFGSLENPYLLMCAQTLDGVSAGIFGVISVIIVSDLARGTGRFNLLQGVVATCVATGASLSNLIGGFVVQRAGFRVSFLTLAVFALLALIFFYVGMPETKVKE